MKKIIVLALSALVAAPVFAAPTDYTIGGIAASVNDGTKEWLVKPGATIAFNEFKWTASKGVSVVTAEDVANSRITVGAKHKASVRQFGGSTAGGAFVQCTTNGTKDADIATVTITDDGKCS
jgi:hypothetical protein